MAYSHPRFYIQLLFWMDGTTAIHQHEFSGAFHVMHGSSIHAHYEFEKARPVTPYLRVGNLRMKKIELLESGRTVPIVSGQQDDSFAVPPGFAVGHGGRAHAARPGDGAAVQLPAAAHRVRSALQRQAHDASQATARRAGAGRRRGYAELVMEMIADLDFERGFSVLHHCMGYLQQLDQWEPVLRAFEKKHGALAAGVAATLKEDVRRSVIKSLRSTIIEPEHRFFLALLMNAPTRDDLLALVAQRFPEEAPVAIVLRWVEELTEVSDEGVTILDASFPETLEVESEAQPELFLSAFRHFLKRDKKLPPAMRDLTAADVKELRAVFAQFDLGPFNPVRSLTPPRSVRLPESLTRNPWTVPVPPPPVPPALSFFPHLSKSCLPPPPPSGNLSTPRGGAPPTRRIPAQVDQPDRQPGQEANRASRSTPILRLRRVRPPLDPPRLARVQHHRRLHHPPHALDDLEARLDRVDVDPQEAQIRTDPAPAPPTPRSASASPATSPAPTTSPTSPSPTTTTDAKSPTQTQKPTELVPWVLPRTIFHFHE